MHYKPDKPVVEVPWRIVYGGEYLLKCKTEGYPEPNIDWYFENKKIDSLKADDRKRLGIVEVKNSIVESWHRRGTLKIRGFTSKNVGVYKCQAMNTLGTTNSADTRLEISFFSDWVLVGISLAGIVVLALVVCLSFRLMVAMKSRIRGSDDDVQVNNYW